MNSRPCIRVSDAECLSAKAFMARPFERSAREVGSAPSARLQ